MCIHVYFLCVYVVSEKIHVIILKNIKSSFLIKILAIIFVEYKKIFKYINLYATNISFLFLCKKKKETQN